MSETTNKEVAVTIDVVVKINYTTPDLVELAQAAQRAYGQSLEWEATNQIVKRAWMDAVKAVLDHINESAQSD